MRPRGIVNLIFSLDEFSPLQSISLGQSGIYERESREETPFSGIFPIIISTILIKLTIPGRLQFFRRRPGDPAWRDPPDGRPRPDPLPGRIGPAARRIRHYPDRRRAGDACGHPGP
jgi:hypothetical protein